MFHAVYARLGAPAGEAKLLDVLRLLDIDPDIRASTPMSAKSR